MKRNPSGYEAWGDFYEKNELLRSADALAVGLSREWLSHAVRMGDIVKILPGVYRKAKQPWDRKARLELIARLLPHATVTLTTALTLHGVLHPDESEVLWLSFDRNAYVPDLSGFGACAVRGRMAPALEQVRSVPIGDAHLRVHSIARAVIECFRFRKRLGERVAIDAMEAALGAFACHPDELREVARRCRIEHLVRSHLAAWSRRETHPDPQGFDRDEQPPIVKRPGRPRRRRDPLPLVGELAWKNGTLPREIADRAILPPPPRPRRAPLDQG